jgi:hypothetical protein
VDPLIRNAIAGGVLLVVALLAGRSRHRVAVGWVCATIALALAGVWGFLDPVALRHDPTWPTLGRLWVWVAFTMLAAAPAGRLLARGPLGVRCVLLSALVGDVAATLWLAGRESSPATRARIALTASATGLLSPLATPSTLLLGVDSSRWLLVGVLWVLCWPRGAVEPEEETGGLTHTRFLWPALIGLLVAVAAASGVILEARVGMELLTEGRDWALPFFSGMGLVFGSIGGETGGSLLAVALLGNADALAQGAGNVLGAGLAIGGLAPLVAARAMKVGWKLWLVQCGLVLAWSWGMAIGVGS